MADYKELSLCECGCGNFVSKLGNKFIKGHQTRIPETRNKISQTTKNMIGFGRKKGSKQPLGFAEAQSKRIKEQIANGTRNKTFHNWTKEAREKLSKNVIDRISNGTFDPSIGGKAAGDVHRGKSKNPEATRKGVETRKKLLAEGKIKTTKGYKHTEKAKEKNRQAHVGKHPWNYNPNKERDYPSPFNTELKKFIKNLDFNRCFNCEISDIALHVHHINWTKADTFIENLVSLCHSCHSKAHGKRNKEYYQNLFYAWAFSREI